MKNKKISYFALGLQFTSSIVVPPVVCIFLALYLQEKYKLGDWIMGVSVALAAVLMFASLFNFAKAAVLLSKKRDEASEEEVNVYELRKQRRD
ncbi:MAG: AtpZ/AtpI family protein [Oscillospiraceae bacterium]|nr:AtpZ/AtpI family protein [Oscillospiraceae bacterium]MBQ8883631.1 AtpZ/AtpI family protein [Oscillospiraceae bacterium]